MQTRSQTILISVVIFCKIFSSSQLTVKFRLPRQWSVNISSILTQVSSHCLATSKDGSDWIQSYFSTRLSNKPHSLPHQDKVMICLLQSSCKKRCLPLKQSIAVVLVSHTREHICVICQGVVDRLPFNHL